MPSLHSCRFGSSEDGVVRGIDADTGRLVDALSPGGTSMRTYGNDE